MNNFVNLIRGSFNLIGNLLRWLQLRKKNWTINISKIQVKDVKRRTVSASGGRSRRRSDNGAQTLMVSSIPLVARIVAWGWGSRQFTTVLSPLIMATSFPPFFFQIKIRPQSDPLMTYSEFGPKKLTPFTVSWFRCPSYTCGFGASWWEASESSAFLCGLEPKLIDLSNR